MLALLERFFKKTIIIFTIISLQLQVFSSVVFAQSASVTANDARSSVQTTETLPILSSASLFPMPTNTQIPVIDITTKSQASANIATSPVVQELPKKMYRSDEDVKVSIANADNDSFHVDVLDAQGKNADAVVSTTSINNQVTFDVAPRAQFRPGRYKLVVTDTTGKSSTQNFSWGVLAINPDRSIYTPGQTADLAMAVLDDQGNMVCDAKLELKITHPNPLPLSSKRTPNVRSLSGRQTSPPDKGELKGVDTLSTDNGKITVNQQCQSHGFSLKPDYEAQYQLGSVGTYAMTLTATTKNGTYNITDSLIVKDSVPFDVQRVSATRIYPPNNYPVQLHITANQDFTGNITETVPDSFTITTASDSAQSYNNMQTIYLSPKKNPALQLQNSLTSLPRTSSTSLTSSGSAVLGAATGTLPLPFNTTFRITQGFGAQLTDIPLRQRYASYGLSGNDGVDFRIPSGTPIFAVDAGNVVLAGQGDYGVTVVVQHSWGRSYYGNVSAATVTKGMHVTDGSQIGYAGSSDEISGATFHFAIKPNNPDMYNGYMGKVDPLAYFHISQTATSVFDFLSDASGNNAATSTAQTTVTDVLSASTSAIPKLPQTTLSDLTITNGNKVKILSWNVSLKKGQQISLGYTFKAPQISPQFYLLGPLTFYPQKSVNNPRAAIFEEARQWQLAADAVGTAWYNNNWQYRKQVTIDHTKVGLPSFDSASAVQHGSASTISWTHTVASQNNRLLIVTISYGSGGQTSSSVTYAGIAMTEVNGAATTCPSSVCLAEMWYLVNPPTGSNTVLVTENAGPGGYVAGSSSYYNVNQTTPLGTAATGSGNSQTASVTVNSTSINLVIVDSMSAQGVGGPYSANSPQTQMYEDNTSMAGGSSRQTGTSSTTSDSWSINPGTGDKWALIAAPINPSNPISYTTATPTFMESGSDATQDMSFWPDHQGCSSDNTLSHTGPRSLKCDSGNFNRKLGGIVADTGSRVSFYFYVQSFSTTDEGIAQICNSSGTDIWRLLLTTATHQLKSNFSGATGSTVLQSGQWYHIVISYTITDASNDQWRVYLNDKLEISDSNIGSSTGSNGLQLGRFSGTGGAALFNFDDIYVDSGSDLSDPGPISVTNKRPNANGSTNQFTTRIGSGGSGYGSGHSPQINEQPLSTTNAWSISTTAKQTEEYNVESSSTGDVNLTGATLLANSGWIYADNASASNSPVSDIIVKGVATAVTMTTSPAMYTQATLSSVYPSGTGTDIGMDGQYTTTAHLWSLFEAGMLIAYYPSGTSLSSFPVLVNLASDNDLKAHAQSTGNDILFTDSTGQTKLNHEIEKYTSATGELEAWINVSNVSASVDTILYMYYGNAAASNQQSVNATWNTNYAGVWHLSQDPSGTAPQMKDSTSNTNNATSNGSMTSGQQVSGQIDGSLSFDGVNDYTSVSDNSTLKPSGDMTMSFWTKLTQTASAKGEDEMFIYKEHSITPFFSYQFYTRSTDNKLDAEWINNSSTDFGTSTNTALSAGTWYYITYVKSGTSAKIYLNGTDDTNTGASASNLSGTLFNSNSPFETGSVDGTFKRVNGIIDEPHILSLALSAGWVKTEYNDQNSPATFYTLGGVETQAYAPTLDQLMRGGKWFCPSTATTAFPNATTCAANPGMQPYTF